MWKRDDLKVQVKHFTSLNGELIDKKVNQKLLNFVAQGDSKVQIFINFSW